MATSHKIRQQVIDGVECVIISLWNKQKFQFESVLIDLDDYLKIKNYTIFLGKDGAVRLYIGQTSKDAILLSRHLFNKISCDMCIDHVNRNKLDNRRKNLRLSTYSQNAANSGPKFGKKYKGINFEKFTGRWKAQITVNYKNINLGRYDFEEEAAQAYDKAAKKYFGEFAYLNFPENA